MNIENEGGGLNKYRQDIIYTILTLLLSTIFFSKILLHPDQIIYSPYSDTISHFYPWYYFADSMLKTGNLPLWNPYTFSGNPFIGNPQIAMFYPLNSLLFFVPTYIAFGYSYLLHIFLAGIFMYIFMRYIKLDKISSFLSGIIFMFSAFLITHIYAGHYTMIAAACWIPSIFLLFEIALNKRSMFYGLLTGILIGIQFLAGHMQISLYTLFALGLYLSFRSFLILRKNKDYKITLKLYSIFALAFFVGILLSAIQLIPSLELSKYTTRAGGVSYEFATSHSFPIQSFITFVLPNFFGNFATETYWNVWNYWELSPYIGILPL
ncbi:MAG: hypothetical protein QXG01_07635, partial [Candidatus Bathyarchaeia archaeon]